MNTLLMADTGDKVVIAYQWDNLWERRGGSMVNGVPREVPRVLNVLPREKIEGPPRDFLKANT